MNTSRLPACVHQLHLPYQRGLVRSKRVCAALLFSCALVAVVGGCPPQETLPGGTQGRDASDPSIASADPFADDAIVDAVTDGSVDWQDDGAGGNDAGVDDDGGGDDPYDVAVIQASDVMVATVVGEPVDVVLTAAGGSGELYFDIVTPPHVGALSEIVRTGNDTAVLTYFPPADFVGSAQFSYVATDGVDESNVGTVFVAVYPELLFAVEPVDGPRPLQVRAYVYTVDGDPVPDGTYTWSFDDQIEAGPMRTHAERDHTFVTPGVHVVRLTVTVLGLVLDVGCAAQSGAVSDAAEVTVWPTVSGRVVDAVGSPVSGVQIAAEGVESTTSTDGTGCYTLHVPYAWSGYVVASAAEYEFESERQLLSAVERDVAGVNFVATESAVMPTSVRISGYVRSDGGGGGISDVVLSASDGGGSDLTDDNGYYEIDLPYGWSGTVTPSHAAYAFEFAQRSYANLVAGQSEQDYIGTLRSFTISGQVIDSGGDPLSGVVLQGLPGDPMTDAGGNYSATVDYGFSAVVTPALASYDFAPVSRTYVSVTADQAGQNYVGTQWTWTISGTVVDDVGDPIEGVTLTADPGGVSAVTNAAGVYALDITHGWTGTVTPAHVTYTFAPASLDYSDVLADEAGQDYVGTPLPGFPISGTVTNWEGDPYAGVPLVFTGTGAWAGADFTVIAEADGSYSQEVPFGWSGTVSSDENYRLEPASREYADVTAPAAGEDYSGFRNYYVDRPGDGFGVDGSDSFTGTYAQPFATIQRGANLAYPGDTVSVRSGVYNETVTVPRSGTSAHPITVMGGAEEAVIMDGQSTLNDAFVSDSRAWWAFQGLEIRSYLRYGFYLVNDADHCAVRYCRIHHVDTGVLLRGADYTLVEWCEMYESSGGVRINWRDSTGNRSDYATIRYNLSYRHGLVAPEAGDGISISGGSYAQVHHNICWLNLDDGIDASGSSSRYPEAANIHHNVSFANGFDDFDVVHTGGGDGNGVKVSTNVGGDHTVHHNVCFRNKRAGFDMDDVSLSWPADRFFNNVAWRNGDHDALAEKAGFILRGKPSGERAVPLKNCVAWGNNPPDRANPSTREDLFEANMGVDAAAADHNVWGRVNVEQPEAVDATDVLLGIGESTEPDPGLFQSADAPLVLDFEYSGDFSEDIPARWSMIWAQVEQNFTPISTEYLIDRGTLVPGITDGFEGAAPDVGAFEGTP